MGTWQQPFRTVTQAKKFAAKMALPWIAEVKQKKADSLKTITVKRKGRAVKKTKRVIPRKQINAWQVNVPELSNFIGNDSIFDRLADIAAKKKRSFDARPTIRLYVKILINYALANPSLHKIPYQAILIAQKAVGMKEKKNQKQMYSKN